MTGLHSGISQREKWIGWAFLIWLLWAIGPGILIANHPVFIGPFPLMYIHALASWILSIVFCYLLGYKMKFTNMEDYEEQVIKEGEAIRNG